MTRIIALILAFALPAPLLAQTTRTATTARSGPGATGVAIAVTSAKLEYLILKRTGADGKSEEFYSNDPLLVVRLKITNNGQSEVTYRTFRGAPDGKNDQASLQESNRKLAALVQFGEYEPAAGVRTTTLKPGESVDDLVAFAAPATGVTPTLLFLPARNHGDTGMWKIPVTLAPDPK